MVRSNDVPATAELFSASAHYVAIEIPSKLVRGKQQRAFAYVCPGCEKQNVEPPEALLPIIDCDCGLSMKLDACGLFVWRRKPALTLVEGDAT
jgi:hypothetical protein